jgi:hypothetical protein
MLDMSHDDAIFPNKIWLFYAIRYSFNSSFDLETDLYMHEYNEIYKYNKKMLELILMFF